MNKNSSNQSQELATESGETLRAAEAVGVAGHSPLPWEWREVRPGRETSDIEIVDAGGERVMLRSCHPMNRANTEFIVNAANSHDAMCKALRGATLALRSYQYGNASPDLAAGIADACEAALALAAKP